MGLTDAGGMTVTMDDPSAVADWDCTVRAFLAHGRETPLALGRTLDAAPDFALGWAAKGLFMALLGQAELMTVAGEAQARAHAALDTAGATERERAYVAALSAWLAGRPSGAVAALDRVLTTHPGDALAMKLDQSIRFLLGDRHGMERAMRRIMPAYDDSHPMEGFALGCLAFALEENGHYAEAERAGRAGIERASDDAWGLHAVAHVYDMTARNDGRHRLAAGSGGALGALQQFRLSCLVASGPFPSRPGRVRRGARPLRHPAYPGRAHGRFPRHRQWRLDADPAGDRRASMSANRWEELAALSAGRVEDGCVIFADLHYLLSLQGDGHEAEAGAADRAHRRRCATFGA